MKPRTILVTGGTGKLGLALVSHFLTSGDCVIATCRTDESLDKLREEYPDSADKLSGIKVDFTEPGAIAALIDQLNAENLFPDCLVNNARSIKFLKIEQNGLVSRENFTNEYLLDVIVPYELTMALMMQKGSQLRKVVNIGSMYGTVAANPHLYINPVQQSAIHYSVAKAALAHLTKELAVRLAGKDIRVNCVAFGGVEGRVDEAFRQRYSRLCPIGRMLQNDEVVGPVDMLLSEKCSGITGHVLAVDGGWSIW